MKYAVVHLISGGEFRTPLVASQVFDRAQEQLNVAGEDKPVSVSVWIIEPFRVLFSKSTGTQIEYLKKRTPGLKIEIIGGINRLNNWPAFPWLNFLRKRLKASKVVYHCRGEEVQVWARYLKEKFPGDAAVTDIRGFGPLEKLHARGISDPEAMDGRSKALYLEAFSVFREVFRTSEQIMTVSNPLKRFLIEQVGAPEDTAVIPCCVKDITENTIRDKKRKELGLEHKTAILYLGGTQKYQHVEDLVLPFIKAAIKISAACTGVIITQDPATMRELVGRAGIPEEKIILLSVAQNEVKNYLPAMDLGLLLRGPSLLNTFSQPVKFGEYISAGLPVIVEEGTGEISTFLEQYQMGSTVKLTGKNEEGIYQEVAKALNWWEAHKEKGRQNAWSFAKEKYTWKAFVPVERKAYIRALQSAQ